MGHKHTDGLIPCPNKRREALKRAVSGTLTKNAEDRVKRFVAGKEKLSASFLIVNGEFEREKKGSESAEAAEKMIILDFLKCKKKETLMHTCRLFLSQLRKEGKQIIKSVNGGIHEITMKMEDKEEDEDEDKDEVKEEVEEEEEEKDEEDEDKDED